MSSPLDSKRHATPLQFFLATNAGELPWLALYTFFYILGQSSMFFALYFLGNLVDSLGVAGRAGSLSSLLVITVLLFGYELGFRIGHVFEILSLSRVRNRIKKALFDHTTSLSFGYFADRFAGEITHKVAQTAHSTAGWVVPRCPTHKTLNYPGCDTAILITI